MKDFLKMSDPLTLGMGQSVTQRIRRLNMRPTKLKGQVIATTVIIAGLMSTASITTYANETVSTAATVSTTETAFLMKLAPSLNPLTAAELEKRRLAYRSGAEGVETLSEWKIPDRGTLFQNHIHVVFDETGKMETFLTDAKGTPVSTSFNAETQNALQPAITICQEQAKNNGLQIKIYQTDLDVFSGEVLPASYRVECHPGTNSQRNSQSSESKLASYLTDDSVDIETRQARGAGIFIRERLQTFSKAYPNPTRAQYFDECMDMWKTLNSDFRSPEERDPIAKTKAHCEAMSDSKFGVSK